MHYQQESIENWFWVYSCPGLVQLLNEEISKKIWTTKGRDIEKIWIDEYVFSKAFQFRGQAV